MRAAGAQNTMSINGRTTPRRSTLQSSSSTSCPELLSDRRVQGMPRESITLFMWGSQPLTICGVEARGALNKLGVPVEPMVVSVMPAAGDLDCCSMAAGWCGYESGAAMESFKNC